MPHPGYRTIPSTAGCLLLALNSHSIGNQPSVFLACGSFSAETGKVPKKPRQVRHPITEPLTLGTTGLFPIISIFSRMSSKLGHQPLRPCLLLSIMPLRFIWMV